MPQPFPFCGILEQIRAIPFFTPEQNKIVFAIGAREVLFVGIPFCRNGKDLAVGALNRTAQMNMRRHARIRTVQQDFSLEPLLAGGNRIRRFWTDIASQLARLVCGELPDCFRPSCDMPLKTQCAEFFQRLRVVNLDLYPEHIASPCSRTSVSPCRRRCRF